MGITDAMKVAVIVFGAVWPVLLNTIEGVRSTDSVMTETARSFALTPGERLRYLVLPSASPRIMAGVRQTMSVALILMVISEMFASSSGLGYRIVYFQRNYLIAEMWSGILLLGLDRRAAGRALQRRREARAALVPRNQGGRTCLTTLLKVEHLKKVYESTTGNVEAIGDISFEMGAGELVCIVGPVRMRQDHAAQVHRRAAAPDAGHGRARRQARHRAAAEHGARVPGVRAQPVPVAHRARQRRAAPQAQEASSRAERDGLIDDALTAVGLDHAAKSYPWQLSGGMQQRVAIARAVAYQPEVLIMDEPFAAVDAQTRADLEDLVRRLHLERGMSILFVTHDIDESVYLGERVVVLSKSPTWVQEDLAIDLAPDRDQITTRALPRFTELRTHVYEQIQRAKRGEALRPTA